MVGVKMEEMKSGDLKAEPSPYKPVSDKAREVSMEMVQDGFDWFKGLVAERRKLPMETVNILSDGRVYTGRQAVANKLIDQLGGRGGGGGLARNRPQAGKGPEDRRLEAKSR